MNHLRYDELKVMKAVILYIIESFGDRSDVYTIAKTAFYAQVRHMTEYGLPLYNDEIHALRFGPVPSSIYDILKIARGDESERRWHKDDGLADVANSIGFKDELFIAKERPDMSCLSKSAVDCLNFAIKKVSGMSFNDIINETHKSPEYKRAFAKGEGSRMDNVEIARDGGAKTGTIEYLQDYYETENFFAQ